MVSYPSEEHRKEHATLQSLSQGLRCSGYRAKGVDKHLHVRGKLNVVEASELVLVCGFSVA